MPRSIQEIIDQADDLAEVFMNFEVAPEDLERGKVLADLHRAALDRIEAEGRVAEEVRLARKKRVPWATIGKLLGTTGEAARQRYGAVA